MRGISTEGEGVEIVAWFTAAGAATKGGDGEIEGDQVRGRWENEE